MNKKINGLFLFILIFICSYIMISYSSSFRIKLDAPAFEYFVESIKHMVLFKTIVSVVICGVVFLAVNLFKKSKTKRI